MNEETLAGAVVTWLGEQGWDCFFEVSPGGGAAADIVGVREPLVAIVEAKVALTLGVIAQIENWKGYGHVRYIAVSAAKRDGGRSYAYALCREKGIGVLLVWESRFDGLNPGGLLVKEEVAPALDRTARRSAVWREWLKPEHKTYAKPGTASGKRWPPFLETCKELRALVRREPGIAMKHALTRFKHHYSSTSSARAALSGLIQRGVIEGIEMRREGKALLLFPSRPEGIF